MKGFTLVAAALLVGAALAGCTEKKDDTNAKGQGTVTSVTASAPKAPVDGKSEVCWDVAGSGNVPHVAIHWDTESHADAADRTFAMYDAGAAYPDNTADLKPAGYDLPGTFCADVDVPTTGTLYVVGHAIGKSGAPGMLSGEVTVAASVTPPSTEQYVLTTTGVPDEVDAGENFTYTLAIVGPPGTSDHIGGHYSRNATSGTGAPGAGDGACVHVNGTLPGTFQITCSIASAGTWHLRGHLRTGTGADVKHFWADDETITVTAPAGSGPANVTSVEKPTLLGTTGALGTAKGGENATVCWTVKGMGTVPHVALHWDDASHATEADRSFAMYDLGAAYPDNATALAPEGYALTAEGARFCTNVMMPASGDLYVVGHALVTGTGVISEELKITATLI